MKRWLLLSCLVLGGCPSRPSAPDASDDAAAMADAVAVLDSSQRDAASSDGAASTDVATSDAIDNDAAVIGDASLVDGASDAMFFFEAGPPEDVGAASPYIEPPTPYSPEDVTVPPLPTTDAAGLPLNDAGQPVLAANSHAEIVLVRPAAVSPLNVLARCGTLVANCVEPGVRSVDACFASVRQCSTADPTTEAPCCPSACVSAFRTARVGGAGPMRAFDRALFSRPSCVPGVDAMLGGVR